MRTILVLNPKGGSGKTTIATNIAAYYALRSKNVVIADFDPQCSAIDWLAHRSDKRAPITGISAANGRARIPPDTQVLVLDAPAGLHAKTITPILRRAETVIVPVVPSPIDLRAAARFHEEIIRAARVAKAQVRVATVANRLRENSPNAAALEEYLGSLTYKDGKKLPLVGYLRQSQNYLRAAERGLSIFELAPSTVAQDLDLWKPLLRWLNSKRSQPTVGTA